MICFFQALAARCRPSQFAKSPAHISDAVLAGAIVHAADLLR